MTIMKAFTDRSVAAIKGAEKVKEYPDAGCANLYLCVQPSGKKSWVWRSRHVVTKKPVKKTLGSAEVHGLADAHDWAKALTAARDAGIDLDEVKKAEAEQIATDRRIEKERDEKTLKWFWDNHYRERHIEGLKDKRESLRMWNKLVEPKLGAIALHKIDHDDIADLISDIYGHAPVTANRVVTMLKTMFKRMLTEFRSQSGLRADPAAYIVKLTKESAASRVLDRRELGYLLSITDSRDGSDYISVYARAIRLIAFTGVRISEALNAPWTEFDLEKGIWEISGDRTKNSLPHVLPLPAEIVAWLKAMKARTNSRFVFSTNGDVPLGGMSKPQASLLDAMKALADRDRLPFVKWSAHDVRRTFSTEMNGLSADDDLTPLVQPHIVEALLNHVSGASKAGVAGIYNRYQYRMEKKAALRLWADHLAVIAAEEKARAAAHASNRALAA